MEIFRVLVLIIFKLDGAAYVFRIYVVLYIIYTFFISFFIYGFVTCKSKKYDDNRVYA